MNWLTKTLAAFKGGSSLNAMWHAGTVAALWRRLLARTRFDYRKEVGDCLDASVVTAPVLWIARALPEAEFEVCRRDKAGNHTEIEDHPMLELIQRPNPHYGDIALWMATVVSFNIAGNAYWVIVRDGSGRPAEVWYVPHWTMEPCWPADGSAFIDCYCYSPGGGAKPILLPFDDVVHFRFGIDPRNPRLGLSPLDGVIREIFVDLESSNFVASLLRNMGVPGVIISPKGGAQPAPEDVEATKTWFKQAFGGDNRGGPLVMGGPTEVSSYGFNPQQMNMSEGRDVAEERVCACLGIPAAIVGFGAGLEQTKVGATMEELRKLAWSNGVLPVARMLADELQRSLLPQFGDATGLMVGIDTSDVVALQEDEDKRSKRALEQFAAGVITLGECRRALGEESDPSHDFFLRPISSIEVPVGQSLARAIAPPVDDGKDRFKAQPSDAALARADAWGTALAQQATGLEKAFSQRLEALFSRYGAEARLAALPILKRDPGTAGKSADALSGADAELAQAILDKLGIPAWQGDLQGDYEAQYEEVTKAMHEAARQAGLGRSLPDVVARSIVAAGGRRAGMVDLADQTKAALYGALAQGRAAGEGATALADRIASHVESGPWGSAATRALVIARTETKYAQNISTIERARAAGVTSMIVFDGRFGFPRSTPSHIARNGSIVTIDQAQAMAAAEHPNGTLSFAPNFEEITQ